MDKEQKARQLLEFKRSVEIILAINIRILMGLKETDPIEDYKTFFHMSGDIMELAEKTFK